MTSHVLVSGITSCDSRGVEALVRSLAGGFRRLGGWRMTVLTQTPATDATLLDLPDVRCVADPFVVSRSLRREPPLPTEQLADTRRHLLADADLLVTTGGDLHTADYGVSTRYLAAPQAARDTDVPVAMLAHSVGPFTSAEDRDRWRDIAARCELLTMRESLSRRYVIDDLGLPAAEVPLTADPAFLLVTSPANRVGGLLAEVGIDPGQPYLCFAPSRGVTRIHDPGPTRRMAVLRAAIERLVGRFGMPVLLVPHAHDSRPHNDDRILVAELAEQAAHPLVRPLLADLNASDYKGVAARSVLVLTERLHFGIAALSSGVPAAAIGHSWKFAGVLADTYGRCMPADRVYLDVRAATANAAADLIDQLDPDLLRDHLTHELPLIRARAWDNFVRTTNLCRTAETDSA